MHLQERLDKMREASENRIPQNKLNIMHQSIDELRRSGILDRALNIGQSAPSFKLMNSRNELVSSETLLSQGPLILTFFRGHW